MSVTETQEQAPAEGLLNPENLAIHLAGKVPLETLTALYVVIEDNAEALAEALAGLIIARSEKTPDKGLAYGQADETFNAELYERVMTERRRRQKEADKNEGAVCGKS